MTRSDFNHDLLASIVVFLVALPLCMGISIASGMPPSAGLITGIIGGIVAGSLAGCKLQVSGPAAGLAVLVFEVVREHGPGALALVVVLAGILQLAAGFAGAGQMFRSISPSVIYGMLSGIGILIFGAQFHVMLDGKPLEGGLQNLIGIPQAIFGAFFPPSGAHMAALLGVVTILVMVFWPKFAPKQLRLVPGALIGVVIATVAASALSLSVRHVDIQGNFFASIHVLGFGELAKAWNGDVALLAISFAFVASAETLLSAAAVDQLHSGPKTNYNRELLAQGAGNTLCGFLGALPMTGVIVRSATNVAAGAHSQLSAVMHGVWILVLVAAMPWLLRLVPTASLAAVLVYTGFKLVNVENARRLLRYGGAPVVIYAVTVVTVVAVDLLTGILAGLGLSVLKVVYARTHFTIRTQVDHVHHRADVYLGGAASFLRLPKLADALELVPADYESHVHLKNLDYVDDACLEVLAGWQKQRSDRGMPVILEWDEALRLYKDKNPLGSFQRSDIPASTAAH